MSSRNQGIGAVWQNLLNLPTNLKTSILRHGTADSNRDRSLTITSNLALHVHSVHTHENSLEPTYTFGLGLISLFLFVLLTVSGIILMVFYVPSTQEAYDRIRDLKYIVPGGQVIRNFHRWAAHAMVAVVLLHMVRVFFTGSYHRPREFNWLIGMALLVVTFGLSFTGYLLPWDQLAFWAITVGANIAKSPQELTDTLGITQYFDPGGVIKRLLLGGNNVEQDALLRFYVLHCVVLPLGAVCLISLHFWRIRKDGGLSRPAESNAPPQDAATVGEESSEPEKLKTFTLMALPKVKSRHVDTPPERTVMTWPNLIIIEASIFMLTFAAMMVLALLIDAPLKELANPVVPENPAKAPWYFLGLQELVSYSAFVGGVGIPTVVLLGIALIPYLDRETDRTGYWFTNARGKKIALWAAVAATIFVTALLVFTVKYGWLRTWFPNVPQLVIILVNPGSVITVAFAVSSLLVAWRTGSTRLSAIALFSMFLVGFVILTIMGTYFRGPNWDFYWSPADWPGGH